MFVILFLAEDKIMISEVKKEKFTCCRRVFNEGVEKSKFKLFLNQTGYQA